MDDLDVDKTRASHDDSMGEAVTRMSDTSGHADFQPGFVFAGRYEILSAGLRGGMGVVYQCRDTKLHRVKALKLIHSHLLKSPQAIERFHQEVAISQELQHEHIVRVYDLGEYEGRDYFTMEWVAGKSLRDLILARKTRKQPFDIHDSYQIISQLCDALQYAHRYTIHRDIKPENILITGEGDALKIKLTDFGIAKMLTASQFTATSLQMGTPYYMAPEQKLDAGQVDKRADIYSVGVVLFELLTLENTIGLEMPTEINAALPAEIDDVVKRALATRPENRYGEANEIAAALLQVVHAERERQEQARKEKIARVEQGAELARRQREKEEEAAERRRKEAREKQEREEQERLEVERRKKDEEERKSKEEAVLLEEVRKQREAEEAEKRKREEEQRRRQGRERKNQRNVLIGIGLVLLVLVVFWLGFRAKEEQKSSSATGMEFVFVKGGCFQMGDTFDDGTPGEKPVHEVCVDDFYIGKYQVTQGQWKAVMGNNPSYFENCGDNCPVEDVSWNDIQQFIERLNSRSGKNYRLPTEAEWEYAARSGGKSEKYAGGNDVDAVAWYEGNSGDKTHPVGQKRPNGLGLYDMSGNVWEWCSDWYGEKYYSQSPRDNPDGPSSGSYRVLRGGSWLNNPVYVRAASRLWYIPEIRDIDFIGFRMALSAR